MEDGWTPNGVSGLGRITTRSSLKVPKQKKPNYLGSDDEDDRRFRHNNTFGNNLNFPLCKKVFVK